MWVDFQKPETRESGGPGEEIKLSEIIVQMEKFRILIVEDSEIYRKLLRNALKEVFPEIIIDEAVDGREGLQKVDAFLPDLIFMDIRLPDEDGLELTKKIKAIHSNISIFILSGYDTQGFREATSQCGAEGFLAKTSFGLEELEELLKSYLKALAN
jgi:DNA-binding NarL/FixJ family response regulator